MSSMSYLYHTNTQTNTVAAINYGYHTTFFDLTMVFSGELHYNIDGQDIILKKNDTLLIPPGSMRIRYAGDKPAHYMSVNYYGIGEEEKSIPLYIPNCRPFFKEALLFFDKILESKIPSTNSAINYGLHLLIELLKNEIENQNLNQHVHRILEYISANLTQPITLDEIADSVFLTVPYCCHLVKKELGFTISEIITRERVALAQQLIISDTIPLNKIPYRCGFNDYSHFYRCFKKHTGISPSQYRNIT